MARLPIEGEENWGGILNEYLLESHTADGSLSEGVVTESTLDPALQSKVNATSESSVASVAGKTGDVELSKSDVGLSDVDNTADVDKPISTATQAALDTKTSPTDVTQAIETVAHTYKETQTFDPVKGFAIGDKLKLFYADGFYGQRLRLTGATPRTPDVMPYLEIVPTTKVGTDTGGAIAGLQVYRTTGGGDTPNREFLAIEASGDNSSMPGFKINTWASGTGVYMPLRIIIGTTEQIRFNADNNINVGAGKRLYFEKTAQTFPLIASREGASFVPLQGRMYNNGVAGPWTMMAHNRGTIASPAVVNSGDVLGEYRAGSMSASTELVGGALRFVATETWTAKRGAAAVLSVNPTGATAQQDVARFQEPTANGDTALLVRVNRAGVITQSQVTVGPPDSGGTGFRALRVAN